MNICGIDISTHEVTLVTIDNDTKAVTGWYRKPLEHHGDAFDRTRQVPLVMPGPAHTFWDDIIAVGIEEPAGRNPGYQFRVQGAVLSCIPRHTLVEKFMPSQWRRLAGLKGNAPKAQVWEHANARPDDGAGAFPTQDLADAYCIALATRNALEKAAT